MIQINLLPSEYRSRERLSLKVWATMFAAVVTVCGAGGYFGHVYLDEYKAVEAQRITREDKLRELKPLASHYDKLVAEAKDYRQRETTIQDIATSRALWTKLLDNFIDIVNNEGNTERHSVWFDNLTVAGGRGKTGPSWNLKALSQSNSFTKQANFLDDVRNDPEFFKDFDMINAPGGAVVSESSKEPPEAISFELRLAMKPSNEWAANVDQQKKPQPKKGR
ncbi:MAG: hypothetical protein H6832_16740 [Planctomycetes bacterium]|nr:hypothetical protein [Planctomycetota bacterium]MCB9890728.1 hypothetical protein [Planctomycetota bacterium]MCB9920049.1 hypothetical protein [Planctomycetota bacterium]